MIRRIPLTFIIGTIFLMVLHSQTVIDGLPAFPGAEGFGAQTSGGRGGVVIEVTNLNDDGPGSLREAIEATGPRTMIFRASGTIRHESKI